MSTTLVYIVLIWIHTITIYICYVFKNYCSLFNIHISRIYHISYPIIFKINVSTYQICIESDTRIVSVHHSLTPYNLKILKLFVIYYCIV